MYVTLNLKPSNSEPLHLQPQFLQLEKALLPGKRFLHGGCGLGPREELGLGSFPVVVIQPNTLRNAPNPSLETLNPKPQTS